MPELNRVKVSIHGIEYSLMSESSPEYIRGLASKLEEQLDSLLVHGKVAITTALMLCGINALDEANTAASEAKTLREQSREWVDALQNAKQQLDEAAARADADRLTIESLTAQLASAQQPAEQPVPVPEATPAPIVTVSADAEAEIEQLRRALAEVTTERDDLRNSLAACEAACDWLRSENESLSGAVRQPDPEAVQALQNAKETVDRLQAEVAQLTAQRDEAITAMKDAAEREASTLSTEMTKRLSDLTAENERLQQESRQQIDAAKQELENLRRINQEQARDIEWLMTETETAQKEAAAAKEEAAYAQSECSTLHALLRGRD